MCEQANVQYWKGYRCKTINWFGTTEDVMRNNPDDTNESVLFKKSHANMTEEPD